jgi:hypothetical protein
MFHFQFLNEPSVAFGVRPDLFYVVQMVCGPVVRWWRKKGWLSLKMDTFQP